MADSKKEKNTKATFLFWFLSLTLSLCVRVSFRLQKPLRVGDIWSLDPKILKEKVPGRSVLCSICCLEATLVPIPPTEKKHASIERYIHWLLYCARTHTHTKKAILLSLRGERERET